MMFKPGVVPMIETIFRRAAAKATWAFIVLLVLLAVSTGLRPGHAQAALPLWQDHRSVAGGFRIEFPGRPRVTTYERGGLTVSQSHFALGGQDFAAASTELPSADVAVDSLFASIRTGVASDGRLRSEDRKDTSGFPSMRLVIDKDRRTMIGLWVLKRNRLITVIATGPSGFDADLASQRFLGSLLVSAD
ncbi:hypothetical protein [Phreatobacter stygius]|uniref:DUF1795 domain-containing protein n=1 Tax=Phreatobacter stygius TaxID=1940610 RepID=A0A4D7B2R2_9HYPH|nr:hypothetical protein [Phreatobacter stygius]QCI67151.1 hypothetical protein E8M01_24680 [Phreatobacter stygius]